MRPLNALLCILTAGLLIFACQTKVEVQAPSAAEQIESGVEVTPQPAQEEVQPVIYRLHLNVSGNGVVMTDSELLPGEYRSGMTLGVPAGTTLNFTAVADPGSTFDGWSDACSGATCSITLDRDTTITAGFLEETSSSPPSSAPTLFNLMVRVRNSLGCDHNVRVEVNPPGADCVASRESTKECDYDYEDGTIVRLTPYPGTGCYAHYSAASLTGPVSYSGRSVDITMTLGGFAIIDFDARP